MSEPTQLLYEPNIPWMGNVTEFAMVGPMLGAMQFTGWRHEATAWKEAAYLGASLSMAPVYRVKGPDAVRFLSDHFVNNFETLKTGGIRHGIMCDAQGRIIADGVVMKVDDDEFVGYWLNPVMEYKLSRGDYDAVGEDLSGQVFLYQVGGPRSLEIIERATGEDLHDLPFARHRTANIGGHPVRILRLGMAGTLSYEIHGSSAGAHEVYRLLAEAGEQYGLVKLGRRAYMLNHTEDGFPQAYYHYPYPWYEDPEFAAWLDERPGAGFFAFNPRLLGSVGADAEIRYMTPFDTGWAGRIHWDHEFVGREALAAVPEESKRRVVTLEWNSKDVVDVYASQFHDGPSYDQMDHPNDMAWDSGVVDDRTGQMRTFGFHADWVLAGGGKVGIASGRAISLSYNRMISLAFLDPAFAEEGAEVTVLWGAPGGLQKQIRARVARFPYLDAPSNQFFDTASIPRQG